MTEFNETRFAARIRPLLNRAATLDATTRERLRAARERALAAHRLETQMMAELALAGARGGGLRGLSLKVLAAALVVGLASAALWNWQQQRLAEVEEIDALLLADDLPLDAYLDRGFQAWLKKQATR